MERKSISSDVITRAYIDSLLVEVRHLDAVMPSTEMTLFGKTFATPVATACTMFATRFDRDPKLSVNLVSLSTLLSVATLPLMIALTHFCEGVL